MNNPPHRLGVMAAFNSYEHLGENFDSLMQRYAEYTCQQQHTNTMTNSSSSGELNTIREEKPSEPIHIVNVVIQHPSNYELDQDIDNKLCAAFIKSKEVGFKKSCSGFVTLLMKFQRAIG